MNRFKIMLVVITISAVLTGCGKSPTSTIDQFYMDVSEGRIEDAMKLFDLAQAESQGFSKEKVKATLVAKSDTYNKVECGGLKTITVTSEEIRGDIANQKIELMCKSGLKMNTVGKLNKTKDGWRIALIMR